MLRMVLRLSLIHMSLLAGLMAALQLVNGQPLCLCVAMMVDTNDARALWLVDVQTGVYYQVVQRDDLTFAALAHDGHLALYVRPAISPPPPTITLIRDHRLEASMPGSFPSWSPDSRLLAYNASRPQQHRIFVLDTATSRTITLETTRPNSELVWSDDSRRAAYVVIYPGRENTGSHEVHLIDVEQERGYQRYVWHGGILSLNWSADGRYLLVLTLEKELLRVDAESGRLLDRVTVAPYIEPYNGVVNVRLAQNGGWLIFMAGSDNRTLVMLRLSDGRAFQLALPVQRVTDVTWWQEAQR